MNMAFQTRFRFFAATTCIFFAFASEALAQTVSVAAEQPQPASEKGLFDTDDLLHITLKGSMRQLLNNRSNSSKNYSLVLSCIKEDSSELAIPVEVRTRGHFRKMKGNCNYPPLLIRFPNDGPHLSSVFREQKKLKLVMPCNDDEYVVREWLVYKIYNLITPKSFRVRLLKVNLEDTENKKEVTPFYGFFLEEETQMAERNQLLTVERKMRPGQTRTDAFLNMAVFQYLIGNTDWSVQYLHNIKLLAADPKSAPVTVPYDFDHAGIVNAPYARPAEELKIRSIRDRRYRGYCVADMKVFENIIAQYNQLKNDIYGIYTGSALLDPKYVKSTIEYIDAFYATINDPKTWQKEFSYPCDPNGTGNVVIKGLKEN